MNIIQKKLVEIFLIRLLLVAIIIIVIVNLNRIMNDHDIGLFFAVILSLFFGFGVAVIGWLIVGFFLYRWDLYKLIEKSLNIGYSYDKSSQRIMIYALVEEDYEYEVYESYYGYGRKKFKRIVKKPIWYLLGTKKEKAKATIIELRSIKKSNNNEWIGMRYAL